MAVFRKKKQSKNTQADADATQPAHASVSPDNIVSPDNTVSPNPKITLPAQDSLQDETRSQRRRRFGWPKRSNPTSVDVSIDAPDQATDGAPLTSADKPAQKRWWRRSSSTASHPEVAPVESTPNVLPASDTPPKKRWWRRKTSRSSVADKLTAPSDAQVDATTYHDVNPYNASAYTEPELPEGARPLNPDGSLPPDLQEEFEVQHAPQNTQRVFQQFLQRVETKSPKEVEQTAAEVDRKLDRMNRGSLAKVWQKVEMLARVVRDPKSHWPSKLMALASLVYVVSPIDAIPDILPALGLADDVAVVITMVGYLAQAVDYAKKIPQELEQQTDREIQKHIHKNRISLVYAAAAAVLVFLAAWAINAFIR